MMDRQMIIGILGQLPTEALLKALSVVAPGGGQGGDDGDMLGGLAMGEGNKIQSWGDRTVKYSGGKDRPGIADKKWADGGGEMNAESGREGQIDDGVDPTNIFLQTGGGV